MSQNHKIEKSEVHPEMLVQGSMRCHALSAQMIS